MEAETKTRIQAGYSLLEIPIGLFIISVMLLLYIAASNSVILNRNAKFQELAAQIAVSSIEDLRATNFNDLPSSGSLSHPLLGDLPNGSLNLTVTDINDDLKQVDVTVGWKESTALARTVKLSSLITRSGI